MTLPLNTDNELNELNHERLQSVNHYVAQVREIISTYTLALQDFPSTLFPKDSRQNTLMKLDTVIDKLDGAYLLSDKDDERVIIGRARIASDCTRSALNMVSTLANAVHGRRNVAAMAGFNESQNILRTALSNAAKEFAESENAAKEQADGLALDIITAISHSIGELGNEAPARTR